ncbi:molybdopterin molybdotransferase MoeA [soil metagenome]
MSPSSTFRSSIAEHAAHIRELVRFEGTERVPVTDALGRVTAEAVASPFDLPLFRNSQMDGFAVRAIDATEGARLPIVGEIPAKPMTPPALEPGTAVRIMTGAVVPAGADAVIPVEDTTVAGDTVVIGRPRAAGAYVREPGSDVRRGDELLPTDRLLAPRHLAVLAAAGIADVLVRRRPTVAVITTGAELVGVGEEPRLGQVFDANSIALTSAIVAAGGEVALVARVPDDAARMTAALEAAAIADVIVTSGGISMGDYEVVRETLEPLGARVGSVRMQPGGPQATAVFAGVPVLCFPGNPVSTQISFELFLAPLLRAAAGLPRVATHTRRLTALVNSMPGTTQLLRARTVGSDWVETVSGPGSHLVAGLAASDALIVIPEDITELQAGDGVEVIPL